MTTIQLEVPDQKRKPRCYLNVSFTLSDGSTVQPLSYEQARHRGVAYYDKQRMKQKLPPVVQPRDFEGYVGPPSWIDEFPGFRWCDKARDYVRD